MIHTATDPSVPASLPPPARMLALITGYWVSQAVYVAAQLGLADRIGDGEKTVAALATETGSHAPSLYRLMRALANAGVLVERPKQSFALTQVGHTLRRGVPGSMRHFALMMVDEYNRQAWGQLGYSVRTGENAFVRVHGEPAFEWMRKHPEQARVFGESMSDLSAVEVPAVVAAYDFARFEKIVDVAGGHGALLAAILRSAPQTQGVLFDSPYVIENARKDAFVQAPDVRARLQTVGGDFFESVPAGADAYVMKYVLHDWADEPALALLRNVRRAIAPKGTLVVVDTVVDDKAENAWAKWLDLNMMVLTGGMERTEAEFRELFAKAGFELKRVVKTGMALAVVEGVAV